MLLGRRREREAATPSAASLAETGDGSGRDATDAALLADVSARQPLLAAINIGLAVCIALLYAGTLPGALLVGWLAAMLVGQATRLAVWRVTRDGPHQSAALTLGSLLGGIVWGAYGLLFGVADVNPDLEPLRPFVLAGMVAGAVISLPAHLPSFFAFMVPALLPFAISLLMEPDPMRNWLGGIAVAFGVGVSLIGFQMHAILTRSIAAGLRNGALLSDLEDARRSLERRVRERTEELAAANRALLREIDERRRTEARVRHLLHHDSLTGIANRTLFHDRLTQAVERARREPSRRFGVLMLDLDGFKKVNDGYGHGVGDQVLAAVGQRLREALRASDTAARFGGDEFAVLATEQRADGGIAEVCRRIREVVAVPIRVGDHDLRIGVTIGVAMHPEHGAAADALIRHADLALYQAKETKTGWLVFDEGMEQTSRARRELEEDLRKALERDEFLVHYQPRFDLATGRISTVEALVRWQHPRRGLVPPGEFIAAAEHCGLVRPIGWRVLEKALDQSRRWSASGWSGRISVNVSPAQFRDDDPAVVVVEAAVAAGVAHDRVELEITESLYLEYATDHVVRSLADLRSAGVSLAIDDFGTGYASLAYLRHLPCDVVKIDRSFVSQIGRHREDEAIVRAVVTLSQGLARRVVAEGVETEEQLAFLREIGCDEAQGFLLARPAEAEVLDRLMG